MNYSSLCTITKNMSILYVEDDIALQEGMVEFFEYYFANVTVANNGLEAIDAYEKSKYDLVVTDISMPKMNGVELSRKIRELNPNQKIIITSAHGDEEYVKELKEIGISKFTLKPIMLDNFIKTIESIFLQSRQLHILVVDDSRLIRFSLLKAIPKIFPDYAFEFHQAIHGQEALDVLKDNPSIKLILSDWNMPIMDGEAFINEVRRNKKYNEKPIIMITSMGEKEKVIKALKSGVNGYIIKPFTDSSLQKGIAKVIEGLVH